VRAAGVAVRPAGLQLRAVIVKGRFNTAILGLLAFIVTMTLIVPACVRSDPNKAIFVPSI
jgi:hypothetical protein